MPYEPIVTLQLVPELGGEYYTRIVPSVSASFIINQNREYIVGEMQYSVSPSGPFEFLTLVPYGLPIDPNA